MKKFHEGDGKEHPEISEKKEAKDPMDTASSKVDKNRYIPESRENYQQRFTFSECYVLVCMETSVSHVWVPFLFFLPLLAPGPTCLFHASALPPGSLTVKQTHEVLELGQQVLMMETQGGGGVRGRDEGEIIALGHLDSRDLYNDAFVTHPKNNWYLELTSNHITS